MEETERIAEQMVDAMLAAHPASGPGSLESTYHACPADELRPRLGGHCVLAVNGLLGTG
jgi:hypothetical protein